MGRQDWDLTGDEEEGVTETVLVIIGLIPLQDHLPLHHLGNGRVSSRLEPLLLLTRAIRCLMGILLQMAENEITAGTGETTMAGGVKGKTTTEEGEALARGMTKAGKETVPMIPGIVITDVKSIISVSFRSSLLEAHNILTLIQ